jgi:hypothetical protein
MFRSVLLSLCCAACVSASAGRAGWADPSSRNPSQAQPAGEPTYISSGASAIDAAVMTSLAVGASAAQRASGGCYANCPPGTVCNPGTGLCDTQPCHNRCSAEETCDTTGPFPNCVARKPVDLQIEHPAP